MAIYQKPTLSSTPNPLKRAWAIVQADRHAYVTINILYYGLVGLGMVMWPYSTLAYRRHS